LSLEEAEQGWPGKPQWLDQCKSLNKTLWRGVEAQHVNATMKLVDSAEEQLVLEQLLEKSKPPLPPGTEQLHYLVNTPFRYPSKHPSRFRRAGQRGIWYGAQTEHTALAETTYWRLQFFRDSEGFKGEALIVDLTVFPARIEGIVIDLTNEPWNQYQAVWTHLTDYKACQALADAARSKAVQWVRYQSVRHTGGVCGAVFDPHAIDVGSLNKQRTWHAKITAERVFLAHGNDRLQFEAAGLGF
jgi:RES domain